VVNVGDYTIGLQTRSATKPVTVSTELNQQLWDLRTGCILGVPPSQEELHKYFDKFYQFFRSQTATAHIRLINLVCAIRRLREQYLSIDRAGYQASSGSNCRTAGNGSCSSRVSLPQTKVQNPCFQSNRNRCSRPDEVCLFLQCMECNGDHEWLDCPKTKT
jgi:hypothetical protein